MQQNANKLLSCILVIAMLLSLVTANITVFAADEIGTAIFYNRTYDEADKGVFDGGSAMPKSNTIEPKKDSSGNQFINITMANSITEDGFFEVPIANATRYIVMEISLSGDKISASGNIQFKDASRADGVLAKIDNSGNVTSAGSDKSMGKLKKGSWLNLAFIVDTQNMTYSSYANGKQIDKNVPVSGSATGMILMRIYISNSETNAGKDLFIDNFRLYEGNALRDIGGAAVAAPAPKPPAEASAAPAATSAVRPDVPIIIPVLDCDNKSKIENAGFTADTKIVKDNKFSAKWSLAANANITITDIPHDFTPYSEFRFWVYGNSKVPVQFYLRFDSNNTSTDGDDYYGRQFTINGDGWQEVIIPISSMQKNRSPLGLDKIESVRLFSTGWDMVNDPNGILYFSSMLLDNSNPEVLPIPTANPGDMSRVADAVCMMLGVPYALSGGQRSPIDPGDTNVVPFRSNGRTLVPIRFVSEKLGASVDYNEGTRVVTIKKDSTTITLTIGSNILTKNGVAAELDVTADIYNDRTFVPLRACAEALDKQVFWDDMGFIVISDKADIFNRTTDLALMLRIISEFIYDRPTGEQILADLKAASPNHPRLLANADDFARIKALRDTDPQIKEWSDRLIRNADSTAVSAGIPTYSVDEGGRLKGTGSQTLLMSWGFAYQMTGDKKYADAAYKHMEAVCKFKDWHPGHFLDAAALMQGVAIGYDWMYDAFTADQRRVMEEALYNHAIKAGLGAYEGTTEGIEPAHGSFGRSGWTTTENNWNAVCNAGLTSAAMAIGDIDKYGADTAKLMGQVIRSIETGVICYAPDGSYPEGPGYWSYGTNNLFTMLEVLDRATGTTYGIFNAPGLDQTSYFPPYIEGTNGMWNFNDCGEGNVDTSHTFYMANKLGNADLAGIRYQEIMSGRKLANIYDILFYDPSRVNRNVQLAPDKYFQGIETVTMRGDWNDPGTVYTGLHGDLNGVNHGNLDMGNFIIDAGGVRFITDLGTENYNLPGFFASGPGAARWTYYRERAEGHNTIVINPGMGEDQVVNAKGKITRFESSARGAIAVLDMASAHGNKVKSANRGLFFTDNRKTVIIQDEIQLSSASEIWWFAHTQGGDITVAADGRSAIITKEGQRMWAGIVSPNADAKFVKMAAVPLPTSPKGNAAEYGRDQFSKLAVHLSGVTEYKMAVVFRLLDPGQDKPETTYTFTDMANWSIPAGEIVIPRLSNLTVNGETISGFNPLSTSYKLVLPYGTTEIPTIDAAADGHTVTITQAASLPGVASIKVVGGDPGLYTIYSVSIRAKAEIDVEASDTPEPDNIAENTLDGDLNTRWAAEGTQWIMYTFATPKELSAVGIAFWKSAERKTTFKLEISTDGEIFKTVYDGAQKSETDILYFYEFEKTAVTAVRITGEGNTSNAWNSILEVAFK